MQRQITLENQNINYTLRKSVKGKRVRLTVYPGGELVVSAPAHVNESVFLQFMKERAKWLLSKIAYFKQFSSRLTVRRPRGLYKKYKENARVIAKERLEYFNQFYGFLIHDVRIKNQKTRWGSCSEKGNLNFNYKIALLPAHLADYIIVHELCHLGEFNHSFRFWDLVRRTIPDYKERRSSLRKNGTVIC